MYKLLSPTIKMLYSLFRNNVYQDFSTSLKMDNLKLCFSFSRNVCSITLTGVTLSNE